MTTGKIDHRTLGALVILVAVGLLAPTSGRAQSVVEYEADVVHSQVEFKVRHLGISWVRGQFNEFSVRFVYDPENPSASWVQTTIAAASIDTDHERRDNHLRSTDFLAVEEHPRITFQSSAVRRLDEERFEIDGDLTIRGVSRPVTLSARLEGKTEIEGQPVIAWTAETAINRKQFGLMWNRVTEAGGFVVGDEVRIELAVEARGPKPEDG